MSAPEPVGYRWGAVEGSTFGFLPAPELSLVEYMVSNCDEGESVHLRMSDGSLVIVRPRAHR